MKYYMTGTGNLEPAGDDLRFWVVLDPELAGYTEPTLDELAFESNPFSFALQIRGGLDPKAVAGLFLYKNKRQAQELAKRHFDAFSGPNSFATESRKTRSRYQPRRRK